MGNIEYYIKKGFIFIPTSQEYTVEELRFIISKIEEKKAKFEKEDYFKHQKELLDGNN